MVFPETCSEGTPGPNGDAQSTVCLLDADATDADQPGGSAPECVVHNVPVKEIPAIVWNYPDHQCSRYALCLWIFFFTIAVFTVLGNLALSLYMTYLHVHDNKELQTLAERLDAQSQILRQIVANQNITLYNPGAGL
ncbi:uncharacterized protein LOC143926943 [Lithobates pipiens]